MYASIVTVSILVMASVVLMFTQGPTDSCKKYVEMGRGYKWGFRTEACEAKLFDHEEIQACYSCVYADMIFEYERAVWLTREGYEKFDFCEKLDEGSFLEESCLVHMNNINVT